VSMGCGASSVAPTPGEGRAGRGEAVALEGCRTDINSKQQNVAETQINTSSLVADDTEQMHQSSPLQPPRSWSIMDPLESTQGGNKQKQPAQSDEAVSSKRGRDGQQKQSSTRSPQSRQSSADAKYQGRSGFKFIWIDASQQQQRDVSSRPESLDRCEDMEISNPIGRVSKSCQDVSSVSLQKSYFARFGDMSPRIYGLLAKARRIRKKPASNRDVDEMGGFCVNFHPVLSLLCDPL
jgi:hypothetical protein